MPVDVEARVIGNTRLSPAYNVIALGPTPTVDLLCADRRYLRKWCGKLNIPYDPSGDEANWSSGALFRSNEIIPPGPYLDQWKSLFKAVGFRGWFELQGYVTSDGPVVTGASATWPTDIPTGKEVDFLLKMAS